MSRGFSQLYLSLGIQRRRPGGGAALLGPLVLLIWLGALVMFAGGAYVAVGPAASDRCAAAWLGRQGGNPARGVRPVTAARSRWMGCMLFWRSRSPVSPPARAVQPDEMLADPALEGRARELSRELRCMVCQNQSIDDSDAPLARDLRLLVRERLKSGDSDRAGAELPGPCAMASSYCSSRVVRLGYGVALGCAGRGAACGRACTCLGARPLKATTLFSQPLRSPMMNNAASTSLPDTDGCFRHARWFLHAYMLCTKIVAACRGHSCQHGPPPHRIRSA